MCVIGTAVEHLSRLFLRLQQTQLSCQAQLQL